MSGERTKGIEYCWCGKQFFWQDPAARDEWWRTHIHVEGAALRGSTTTTPEL
jgi:hypothetical protein